MHIPNHPQYTLSSVNFSTFSIVPSIDLPRPPPLTTVQITVETATLQIKTLTVFLFFVIQLDESNNFVNIL